MKIMTLVLIIGVITHPAYSQCEREKENVNKWNKILKYKVTEKARNKHREAKNLFLDCLRQPVIETSKEAPKKTKSKASPKLIKNSNNNKNAKYTFPSRTSSHHIIVSDYTNFKGRKKQAWNRYFSESAECLSNKNDMKTFVACAEMRKKQLKIFNIRWDQQRQQLYQSPLLENE